MEKRGMTGPTGGRLATELAAQTVGNTAVETALRGYTFGANTLQKGARGRMRIFAAITTKAAPVGALTFKVYLGATLIQTVAMAPAQNLSGEEMVLEAEFNVLVQGASGSVQVGAFAVSSEATLQDAQAPSAAVSVALNASKEFKASVTWATQDVSNICAVRMVTIDLN
jgi:hypothetical protein